MQLSLLFVWFFPSSYPVMFNDNFWFLSVLFTLYLLFPLLNRAADMLGDKSKRVLCIMLPAASFYCYYASITLGQAFQSYYMSPLFRIFEFGLGIVLSDISAGSSRKIRWYTVCGVTAGCIVLLIKAYPTFGTMYNLYNIILLPYYSFLLFAAAAGRGDKPGNKALLYIAECGLCIYSCQSITIMLKPWFTHNRGITYIVVTLIAAVVMHEIVEKPCRRRLRQLIK